MVLRIEQHSGRLQDMLRNTATLYILVHACVCRINRCAKVTHSPQELRTGCRLCVCREGRKERETCRNVSFKKHDNLHLCASSLSSESPHLSASSGVGLQMKAERFFNKPISARFLIV